MNLEPDDCKLYHYCSEELGFCETTWPCGDKLTRTDKCTRHELKPFNMSLAKHSTEADIEEALALWLHEVFARHTFETEEQDPSQQRKRALIGFLTVLCSYFPDHLQGRHG